MYYLYIILLIIMIFVRSKNCANVNILSNLPHWEICNAKKQILEFSQEQKNNVWCPAPAQHLGDILPVGKTECSSIRMEELWLPVSHLNLFAEMSTHQEGSFLYEIFLVVWFL